MHSPWARLRKVQLADLVDAPFLSPASETPGGSAVIRAFRAAGLPAPQPTVTTFSVHVRNVLSMSGRFIAVLPASILRFDPGLHALKELPLDLPMPRWPALMATLKDRTLSPAVERFMACARDVAKAMQAPSRKSA
jgi:DNA-binding transcriptional LysR family regulator